MHILNKASMDAVSGGWVWSAVETVLGATLIALPFSMKACPAPLLIFLCGSGAVLAVDGMIRITESVTNDALPSSINNREGTL